MFFFLLVGLTENVRSSSKRNKKSAVVLLEGGDEISQSSLQVK